MNLPRYIKRKFLLDNLTKLIGTSVAIKVTATILAFILNISLARILGVSDFGLYSYTISVLLILALIGTLGLDKSAIKYLPCYLESNEHNKYINFKSYAYKYLLTTSLTISTLLLIYNSTLEGIYYESAYFWCALLLPLVCLTSLQSATLRAHNKLGLAQIPQDIFRPLFIIFVITSTYYIFRLDITFTFALCALFVAQIFQNGIYYFSVNRIENECNMLFEQKYLEKSWFISAASITAISATNFILYQSDIILINLLIGNYETGLYSSAVKLTLLIGFFLGAIELVAAPLIARYSNENNHQELQKLTKRFSIYIAAGSIPICLLFIIAPELILQIFGAEYRAAANVLIVLSIAKLIHALSGVAGYLLIMSGLDKYLLKIQIANSILNITLNIILLPLIGIIGAAISTLICTILQSACTIYFCIKKTGINPSIFTLKA